MDTPTHMLLGAAAALVIAPREGVRAAGIGALAALIPDLDVLLAPIGDPALPFALHRHFSHALAMVPVIAALACLPFLTAASVRRAPAPLLIAATVAALSHGLLDAATSYGTHLLWPFTEARTAWDVLPIIHPAITGSLLLAVTAALLKSPLRRRIALAGVGVVLLAAGIGAVQRTRAVEAQDRLADARGHTIVHRRVVPMPGTLRLFRGVYLDDAGTLHGDGIFTPFTSAVLYRSGGSAPSGDPRNGIAESAARADAESGRRARVYATFADGLMHVTPGDHPAEWIYWDARLSLDAAGFEPLWGLAVRPGGEAGGRDPLRWARGPGRDRERIAALWREIHGRDPRYGPLPDRR